MSSPDPSSRGTSVLTPPAESVSRPARGDAIGPARALAELVLGLCRESPASEALAALSPRLAELRRSAAGGETLLDCVQRLRSDRSFDLLLARVQLLLADDPFHQVEDLREGLSTLTTVRMEGCDPQRVLAALIDMPWSRWWRHSRVVDWRRETGTRFVLWPAWLRVPLRVRITIDATREEVERAGGLERRKLVLPARFEGHFRGPARFEIVRLPDGCVLRAAWEGVEPCGWVRVLSRARMAANHLAAERGELRWATGGGYLGLRRFLHRDG